MGERKLAALQAHEKGTWGKVIQNEYIYTDEGEEIRISMHWVQSPSGKKFFDIEQHDGWSR